MSGNTFYLIDTFSLKRSIILNQRRNVENQIYLSLIKVEFFFALIILTLCPHRQPYRGVSDWAQPILTHIRTHMYAHTHTQSPIHISAYHAQQSCTCIEYRIHIYAAHNPHTERTQFSHNPHTICTHTNTHKHIWFYCLWQHIKKLYNTAIYKLYTNYIHFGHLIDEVSK